MADNRIMEEIFKTIDIITDYKLELTEYTYTEDCTVIAKTDDPFSYKILFQKQEYDAHSPLGEVYEIGQSVVVLFTDYSRITKKIIMYGNSTDTSNIKTMNETRFLNNVRIKSQPVPINTETGVEYDSYAPYLVFEPVSYSSENLIEIASTPKIAMINPYTKNYVSAIEFYSTFDSEGSYMQAYFPGGNVRIFSDVNNPIAYDVRGVSFRGTSSSANLATVTINNPSGDGIRIGVNSYLDDFIAFYFQGYRMGSIWSDGSDTYYSNLSDYRLKENITPLDTKESLARVMRLSPVSFDWKNSKKNSEGFIAHEVQEIIPLAVSGAKDEIEKDGDLKYQSLDASKMIPVLVSSVQELALEVERLKEEIKQLKGGSYNGS